MYFRINYCIFIYKIKKDKNNREYFKDSDVIILLDSIGENKKFKI